MLLDTAAELVSSGPLQEVTMDKVAAVAGVSRALVYKHFANRLDMLHALYRREGEYVNRVLVQDIRKASTLSEKLYALIRGSLSVQQSRGATFAALATLGLRPSPQLNLRFRGHGRLLRAFTEQTVEEIGLDPETAEEALTMALNAIPLVLNQFRQRPAPEYADRLASIYVTMTVEGLKGLLT
jgi:AcrR family transcriptional regulator